ncbi:DUF3888 domain-containing protein [Clostridium botulinum]|nr:DUF3888 domain-containing protein [Clostridium botulinum]
MIITNIIFLTIVFTVRCYSTVHANSSLTNTSIITEKESQKNLENDLILSVFSPYVAKAIENYYGEPRQFDLWDAKIINIKRLEPGSFNFEIKISVTTFKAPHNPPYGLETVTIKVDDSGKHIVNFKHESI